MKTTRRVTIDVEITTEEGDEAGAELEAIRALTGVYLARPSPELTLRFVRVVRVQQEVSDK